jgi:Protein of unknown function, DUF481
MNRAPLSFAATSLLLSLFVSLFLSPLLAAPALAQSTPTFTYAKPDAPKPVEVAKPATPPPPPPPPVEWKAQVKGGFTLTTGNSQTIGGVVGGSASRKEAGNRVTVDGGAAYGRSSVIQPTVVTDTTATPPTNTITQLGRNDIETTNNWFLKGRYDRFFTLNNSGYVSAQAAADKIAGKSFFGGGQIGYSRQLYKSTMNLVVAEIGYDLSYERYVQIPMTTHDPVTIHSARVFAGETLTLTPSTGITASVEALFNLNKEGAALNASTGSTPGIPATAGVDAFKDTRVNGKVGLTTTVFKRLSIGFGVTVRYDQNPAPLPIPSGVPAGTVFSTMALGTPFAEKVDTLTEATVIYTFF